MREIETFLKKMLRGERGSALLVTLMVMVGLSLLGLGFVAISETESAISVNQRNYAETQVVSEAAAKATVEWFQNPTWTSTKGLMPAYNHADVAAMKPDRWLTIASVLTNVGKYKPAANPFCCDKPFRPAQPDRLYGTEDSPDILINSTTSATFLAAFNALVFPATTTTNIAVPHVTELRIFAPPILGGTTNSKGFIELGTRYGLATVEATAEMRDAWPNGNVLAHRRTKMVISEWPFPGPQGPVQSNANISTGGNVVVHWGKMTSQGTSFVKRELVGLPWLHASHRLTFEYGYDSSEAWAPTTSFAALKVVYPTDAAVAELYAYQATGVGSASTAGAPPGTWNTTLNALWTESNGKQWKTINAKQYKIDTTNYLAAYKYLYSVQGDGGGNDRDIDDPWVEVRARGAITNSSVTGCCAASPQPFRYTDPATQDVQNNSGVAGLSNWFQLQDITDEAANKKEVTFPKIDYKFWKELALSAKGQEGVHYLKWVSADNFTDGRSTKSFKEWTNVTAGAKPGFYFFDTKNGQNPQVPGGSAYLTPGFKVSNSGGGDWQMSGFIYLNAVDFGTTGVKGKDGRYGFPGEPYRDIGYWMADVHVAVGATANLKKNVALTAYVLDNTKAGNGKWDYDDVNDNGKFDLFLASKTVTRPDTTSYTGYFPVMFFDGCIPGDNSGSIAGANCSEPHEPYLNIVYPSASCCVSGSYPKKLTIQWENPASPTRRAKAYVTGTTLPTTSGAGIGTCTNSAQYDMCTSNGYDKDGPLDDWSGSGQNGAPLLDGVFYNEGQFTDTAGNGRYFGSVLINGDIDPTGTAEVWFDERLIKNAWPPPEWPFPRAFVTAISTDQ